MMEDWVKMKIENLVLNTKLKDPNKHPDATFKYIDVSAVSNTLFKIENYVILVGKEAPSRARKLINFQDIIFATVRPTLMRIALVPKELDGEVCSTGYCVLKPNQEKIDPQFLYYSVLTDFFIEKISKLQKGASYPAIRDSDLKNQIITLPPLPEQRKIAHVLTTVQKAIKQQDNLIRTTTELKKALMQKLFTEGTRGEPQRKTEIGLVPESWEVVELGKHSQIRTSFPTFNKLVAKYESIKQGTEFFFLKVSDMNIAGNEIFIYESNNKFLNDKPTDFTNGFIKPNSLIFPKRGAAISTNKKRITTKYSVLDPNLIGVEPDSNIDTKFLYNYFEMFDLSSLQDNNVIPQLNKHNVAGVKFPLPSIEEQRIIAKDIGIIDNKVEMLANKKQTLTALFKTLLHELMTGQRRVHEVEFEALIKDTAQEGEKHHSHEIE